MLQHSNTFFVVDGDELYITSIDKSNLTTQGWILNERGKLTVSHYMAVQIIIFPFRSNIFVILNIGEYFMV